MGLLGYTMGYTNPFSGYTWVTQMGLLGYTMGYTMGYTNPFSGYTMGYTNPFSGYTWVTQMGLLGYTNPFFWLHKWVFRVTQKGFSGYTKSNYNILSQAKQNDFGYPKLLFSHNFKSIYVNKFSHSK
jgi:hypothetical protein